MPTVRTVPFPLCKTFPCVISRGDSSTLRWSSILFDAEMRQRQWRGCVSDTFSKNSITVSTWGLHCLSRKGNSVSEPPGLRRVGRVSRMHRPLYAADPVVTVAATAPLTVVTLWLQTATLLSERSRVRSSGRSDSRHRQFNAR